jgi:predicted dehydrogenase
MVGVNQKPGVALLGAGFVGRVHLDAIRRLGFVEVRGLAVSNAGRAAEAAAELGIEKVVADYRTLLDDSTVNAVDICTPNALHFSMAKDALEAGKHVICEKPLATSAEQARQLVALASAKKLRNCTCTGPVSARVLPVPLTSRAKSGSGTGWSGI